MEELHRSVLRYLRIDIAKNLNVSNISQVLYSHRILDEDDLEEINAEKTVKKKALFLLDLLPKRGPRAFEVFRQALSSCKYSFLAKRIQAVLSGECSEDVDDRKPKAFGLLSEVPNFVGRTALCGEIKGLLTNRDGSKLVTLVSPPGFGKTAVATTVGYMIEADCRNDVFFFSLKEMSTLTTLAKEMLKAVELPVGEEPIKQITRHFTSLVRDTVLILDNTENLQREDVQFEEFLERIGHAQCVSTLMTSRQPISKLEFFPFLTKHISLEPLNRINSAHFLRDRVPGISAQWENCFAEDCNGVPLLLKITSAFLKSGTVEPLELHKKLQNCPHGFLGLSDPLIIQNLYCPLEVFFNHLPSALRSCLQPLAVFPTTFTAEEALTLFPTHDVLDFQLLLGQLVQHALLQKDQVSGWYSIHPLVQAFCKLSRDDPGAAFNTGLRFFSQHYLTMLRQLSNDFISTDCESAINKYNKNKTNIHHALLSSTEDMTLRYFGLKVSTEAVNFLAKVLSLDEFMSLYSSLKEVASCLNDKTCYSECLVSIGFKRLCFDGFRFAYEAKNILSQAFEIQTGLSISDTECYGHCMSKLGLCLVASGDVKKGISLIAQAIAVRKQRVYSVNSGNNERMLLAGSFCDLGMALFTLGHYKAAVNIWTNISLVRYQELLGNHPFTASLLGNIGSVHQKLHNSRCAVSFNKRCLTMRRKLLGDDHQDTARAYYGLGCSLGALGDTMKALEMLNKGLKIQLRIHSSKHDIERSRQEINSIRGRVEQELPCTMLQSLCLGN